MLQSLGSGAQYYGAGEYEIYHPHASTAQRQDCKTSSLAETVCIQR